MLLAAQKSIRPDRCPSSRTFRWAKRDTVTLTERGRNSRFRPERAKRSLFLLAPGPKASRNRPLRPQSEKQGSKGVSQAERRNPGQGRLAALVPLERAGIVTEAAMDREGEVGADLVPLHSQFAGEVQVQTVSASVAVAVQDVG